MRPHDRLALSVPAERSRAGLALLASLVFLLALPAAPARAAADAATLTTLGTRQTGDEFLTPEEAFKLEVRATAPDRIEIRYTVAKGYYLYRDKLKFGMTAHDRATLGAPGLPEGETKTDENFGTQVVYHHDFVVQLPVSRSGAGSFTLPLKLTWQGCAEAGLCFPPQTGMFDVAMPPADGRAAAGPLRGASGDGYVSEQDRLALLIRSGNLVLMAGAFFLAGLLLAFTPCVLPMVPIVAGIIAGHGANLSRLKGFSLSLAYVLGMALTYTAAGVAFAAAGQQAQTLFQQPWIIGLFALLFAIMAVSMFGFFTVQMPSFIQSRLADLSNRQRAGSYAGVAAMGALSALIVTTCVGPALVAALSVIGQSGQMVRGGVALFAMAMGMGTPLLVVGASAGQLLPRAGAWMDTVKQVFGAMMLAVAAWMLSRILRDPIAMLVWILPLAALAIVLWRAVISGRNARVLVRSLAVIASVYAVLILVGATKGATDPLRPLQFAEARVELPFQRIKSLEELNAKVTAASATGKSVMLDFYADWCVSCKEMEKYTFPQPEVRAALANTIWLQADVTANDATDQTLLKHFGIYGPPTIAFYGADGQERRSFRVVGFIKAAEFAQLATQALGGAGETPAVAAR